MTKLIREDVASKIDEYADMLVNDAAQVEALVAEGVPTVTKSDLDDALAKRVQAAYYSRAAQLLRSDKKGVAL